MKSPGRSSKQDQVRADGARGAVRLDKWLWAARFFKTRSLAATAVNGGKVHLNGARTKPARALRIGDMLEIRRGEETYTVVIKALSTRRGPATEARLLYEETTESLTRRQIQREQRRFQQAAAPHPGHRPSKKNRRRLMAWKGKCG